MTRTVVPALAAVILGLVLLTAGCDGGTAKPPKQETPEEKEKRIREGLKSSDAAEQKKAIDEAVREYAPATQEAP